MPRKTLQEMYDRLPRRAPGEPSDPKNDLCAKILWVEGVMSVLEVLTDVPSLDQLPAVIWSMRAEGVAIYRDVADEARTLFGPLEILRAEMAAMQANRRNGGL